MTERDDANKGVEEGEAPAADDASSLQAELAAAREEARQNHDLWLRERADAENLRKRTARERTETVKFATERLLSDVLPVVDDLERALTHAQSAGEGGTLAEGVALVLKGLREVLERHGVSPIEAVGVPFDPKQHEAMAQVETTAHPPNSVIEDHRRGYWVHDRLLRASLVTVAKAPEGGAEVARDRSDD